MLYAEPGLRLFFIIYVAPDIATWKTAAAGLAVTVL